MYLHNAVMLEYNQSCYKKLRLMFARETNVILLTVEVITAEVITQLCAQNAQTEAHTETNYTTADTRFILHIYTTV